MASSQSSPGMKLSSKRPRLSSNSDKMHQMSHSQEKQKTSFETQPLNISDISIQKATEVVPATL